MKVCIDGKYVERIPDEIAELEAMQVRPDYKESIVSAIREKYSVDDELAILHQRDTKPEEFAEYFNFVENIKQNLKNEETTQGG